MTLISSISAALGYGWRRRLEGVVWRPTPSGYWLDGRSQGWAWPVSS